MIRTCVVLLVAMAAAGCPSATPTPKPLPDQETQRQEPTPPVQQPVAGAPVVRHLRAGLVGEDVNDTRNITAIELNLLADGRLQLFDKNEQPPVQTDLLTDWPSITMVVDEWGEAALVDLDGDPTLDLVIHIAGPSGGTGELRVYLDATAQPRQAASFNARIVDATGRALTVTKLAHAPDGALYVKTGGDPQAAVHINAQNFDVAATTLAPYPTVPFDWSTLNTGP